MPATRSRQQSQASMSTIASTSRTSRRKKDSDPPILLEQIPKSLNSQASLTRVRSTHKSFAPPSPASNKNSKLTANTPQAQMSSTQNDNSRPQLRTCRASGSSKDHDMLRQTSAHTSKGFGRIVKAAVQAPMDISVSITKGFHNAPKLWGDDTVRPQEQVSDLKSGFKAIGKEFGFGFYDGVTGLFTQPWKGAQKDGASGFFKGIGKGIGGFATKPGAALFGIPSYFMKGVHKEVQKLYGSNVQNYIIATRTAQGYEDWLQSSDAEKQEVIVRWTLIQKYLKKERNPDEIVRDVLEAQRDMSMKDKVREAGQIGKHTTSSAQSPYSIDAPVRDHENAMGAWGDAQSRMRSIKTASERSTLAAENTETARLPVQGMSFVASNEDIESEQFAKGNSDRLQRQRGAVDVQTDEETLRHASEALDYEKQLNRAMEQSLVEQRENYREWDGERLKRKTEEEIVMDYVKKQSLLEVHHESKGKARAV